MAYAMADGDQQIDKVVFPFPSMSDTYTRMTKAEGWKAFWFGSNPNLKPWVSNCAYQNKLGDG